jgi:membrane associated rhomboid family serine protease
MRLRRLTIEKTAVTAVLAAWYFFGPQYGYENGLTPKVSLPDHVLYMLSHANVWHLLGNLFVLWIMRNRLYLASSVLIAFAASFLPVFSPVWPLDGVTMGFSGVIFAIFGVKWGVCCQSFRPAGMDAVREKTWEFATKVVPFAIAGIIIPHVNWCLHLYCLLMGFAYGRWRWKHFLK